MDIIKLASNLGVKEEQPVWLQQKIQLSNQLAFMLSGLALSFVVIIQLFFPLVWWLPTVAMLAFLAAPIITANGFHEIARMTIVLSPFFVVITFSALLSSENQAPPYGLWSLALSFLALVFAIFDHKEYKFIAICVSFMIATLLFFEQINDILNIKGLNYALSISWPFMLFCTMISAIVIVLSLFMLQRYTQASELASQQLFQTLAEKQQIMETSEAALKTTLEEVQKNRTQEEQRTWIANGVSHIIELTRNEDQTNLYDNLVSYLVKYMKINQGAIYTVEEGADNQPFIQLKSMFAYERKKYIDKRIEIGQGLVGQCYLEQTKTVLKKVPEDYIKITSGLGQATPRFLALVPLMQNDHVEGIIEIASFRELAPFELEFLDKAGENLASFIRATRINEKTKLLLEQSRKQTEEMRQQEEEMRQNMEELAATQEQQIRLQDDLREKIEQLERVKDDMEQQRIVEQKKAEERTEKRTMIMQHAAEQYKVKEAEMLAKLEEQAALIEELLKNKQ